MGRQLVYDIEANNLLPEVTKLHTIQAIDIATREEFYYGPAVPMDDPYASPLLCSPSGCADAGIELLNEADLAVAHNGYDYDRRALRKLRPAIYRGPKKERDSILLTKLIWPAEALIGPDLKSIRAGRLAPNLLKSHGLKAWGQRLGILKDDYKGGFEEWNPEMASYAMQDVRVLLALWLLICERLGWGPLDAG